MTQKLQLFKEVTNWPRTYPRKDDPCHGLWPISPMTCRCLT